VIDNWPHKEIDWYSEYKFRHAPLTTRWLSCPGDEVKGLTSLTARNTHKHLLITPLDDGAISIWSPTNSTDIREVARSKPGVLSTPPPPASRKSRVVELGDNAVASSELDRIYVASHSTLIELSLTTLQTISFTKFPFSISTLSSEVVLPHPLTVGTTLTLHLHDPRIASANAAPSTVLPQTFPENYTNHAPLFQPSPLAILHHPNNSLYVAGRFPSILCYDRAMWPRLQGTLYSGASLCSLAADGIGGLIAGGNYNGRGTLESYNLAPAQDLPQQKNRQSAAWGKILSVAKQGARVVSCDSEGGISWFEKDCRYVVRRKDVYEPEYQLEVGTLTPELAYGPARKVVVMEGGEGEGLGVWAGDRLGVLAPSRKDSEDEEEGDGVLVESKEEILENEMAERMRMALHAHAHDLRILGTPGGLT